MIFGITVYVLMSTIKLMVGTLTHSEALFADGLNNLSDVLVSVAIFVGLKISQRPPDEDHHYGHLRAEIIAALIAAIFMVLVGLNVLFTSIMGLIRGKNVEFSWTGFLTALITSIIMIGVAQYNFRLSKKTNSLSIDAAARDNLSDALVGFGASIGIIAAKFGLSWPDSVVAFLIGIIILKTAHEIIKGSLLDLSDGFSNEDRKFIYDIINDNPNVRKLKKFSARTHGNVTFVDLTVLVDSNISVQEAHNITDEIESEVKRQKPFCFCHIHVEPTPPLHD